MRPKYRGTSRWAPSDVAYLVKKANRMPPPQSWGSLRGLAVRIWRILSIEEHRSLSNGGFKSALGALSPEYKRGGSRRESKALSATPQTLRSRVQKHHRSPPLIENFTTINLPPSFVLSFHGEPWLEPPFPFEPGVSSKDPMPKPLVWPCA